MTTTWEQLHSSEGMANEKRTVVLPACGMPVHRVCGHVIRAIVQHDFWMKLFCESSEGMVLHGSEISAPQDGQLIPSALDRPGQPILLASGPIVFCG